ncbi:tRNA pseudouridine(55) synthase TruB [Paenibacillus oryzisoli]|uniref:tRNA pseudouridine(55) synthase TruB n=1 Tax=Paenibacillus oryzisoli TaxID=1850517 RepID=UPI003D2818C0
MTVEGILPVWKPAGFTSHDVVAKVRRIVGMKRVGHTGTLDPQVTGVLPLCLGRATRMVEFIQDLPKEYEAELRIGVSTDTEDATGTVLEEVAEVKLTETQVRSALQAFVGEIEQVPPMYSAVKVDGKRLYELAREGKEVERKARKVTIYKIEVLEMDLAAQHPVIRYRALCSKGTYIRTLCVDIGRALGYPATMASLIRTSTGNIRQEQCFTFEQIEQMKADGTLEQRMIPMDQAIAHLPSVALTEQEAVSAQQGKHVRLDSARIGQVKDDPTPLYRAYAPDARFLGLYEWHSKNRVLVPAKVFL